MRLVVYLPKIEINEATSYYVDLVRDGLTPLFDEVKTVEDVNLIEKDDIVFIITLASFLKVIKHHWAQKTIFWYQGILPEELVYAFNDGSLRCKIRTYYYSLLERLALRKNGVNLFVSEAMSLHYQKKYGYSKKNYLIIPCFNQELNKEAFFTPDKYDTPTFVYAGAVLKWQCIRETLVFFKKIKEQNANARLTLLTKNKDEAEELISEVGVNDVDIQFVPLKDLPNVMSKFKYGFLLREDVALNNVATPTKFNSYMSLGIIPVLSDVVHDYRKYINKMKYVVKVDNLTDFSNSLKAVGDIESQKIVANDILSEYTSIFSEYYNPESYKEDLRKVAKKYLGL